MQLFLIAFVVFGLVNVAYRLQLLKRQVSELQLQVRALERRSP